MSVNETGPWPVPPLQVTISVEHGTFSVAQYSGVTITGDGTSTIVMTGKVQAIDAVLAGGDEQPPQNYFSTAGPGAMIPAVASATTASAAVVTPAVMFDYEGLTYETDLGYVGPDTLTISVATPTISNSPTKTETLAINVANTGPPSVIPSQTTSTYTIGESAPWRSTRGSSSFPAMPT